MPQTARVSIVESLLAWHDPAARSLPWRAAGVGPWGVLVSEIMTQQTQAERAAAAWQSFIAAFPTPAALAAAPPGAVIARWSGLGYNRRAVNLHRAAQEIVAHHDGAVPRRLDDLLALPGVGPYTARAVRAFAFAAPQLPVDTNVARILARTRGAPLARAAAQTAGDALVAEHGGAPGFAGVLGGALMDLGATVCTARSPRCGVCPLRPSCGFASAREADPDTADPAARTAHRSRPQGRFDGSRRQARGRVVAALREGPLATEAALRLAGDHGPGLLDALVRDGLADRADDGFVLPGRSGKAGASGA